jgi:D-arginine dehydrogenase
MRTRETHDVLILGGGVAGLATAWHLGQRGSASVLVCEREPLLGSMASAQNAAILRTLGADPLTTRLARAGADFLRRPPAGFTEVPLVEPTGLLLVAAGEAADALERVRRELPDGGGARALDATEARRLAPHLGHAPDDATRLFLFFPDEGRIDVAALVDALAAGARASGVELRTSAAAERLLVEEGRVCGTVLADGSTVRARTTVLAAGGWAGLLGHAAGSRVRLRPTRRHLLVTAADTAVDPRWPVLWIEDAGFYCRPESGGLLLSACDLVDVHPDACLPDPEVKGAIAAKTTRHLPAHAHAGAAHFWCGLRTLTADDRFALGPDPDLRGLFWVAGLGGHGMTAGTEVGRLAASLLLGGAEDPELALALAPGRTAAPDRRVTRAGREPVLDA